MNNKGISPSICTFILVAIAMVLLFSSGCKTEGEKYCEKLSLDNYYINCSEIIEYYDSYQIRCTLRNRGIYECEKTYITNNNSFFEVQTCQADILKETFKMCKKNIPEEIKDIKVIEPDKEKFCDEHIYSESCKCIEWGFDNVELCNYRAELIDLKNIENDLINNGIYEDWFGLVPIYGYGIREIWNDLSPEESKKIPAQQFNCSFSREYNYGLETDYYLYKDINRCFYTTLSPDKLNINIDYCFNEYSMKEEICKKAIWDSDKE